MIPVALALTVVDIVLTGGYLVWDVFFSPDAEEITQNLLYAFQGGMSFGEFITDFWYIPLFILGLVLLCLNLAFPAKKRRK